MKLYLTFSSVFPSLYRDMKYPKSYNYMVNISYLITTLTYLLIGISGYLMFGNTVLEEITLNLPNTFRNRFTIWLIALNPLTKYPLTIHPLNTELESWIRTKTSVNPLFLSRLLMSFFVITVSIITPGFDLIMAIIGSTFSFTVSVIFPEICYSKLYELTLLEKIISWSLIYGGFIFALTGTLWPLLGFFL